VRERRGNHPAEGGDTHHLPGTNTFLKEYQAKHGIPEEAAMGGPETMYPEYRSKLAGAGARPGK